MLQDDDFSHLSMDYIKKKVRSREDFDLAGWFKHCTDCPDCCQYLIYRAKKGKLKVTQKALKALDGELKEQVVKALIEGTINSMQV